MNRWPNFFLVGAPRCGTTSLYHYLNQSPEVFMSPTKEPRFFNSPEFVNVYTEPIRDEKKYQSLFNDLKNEKAVGEASTSYLQDVTTPLKIHELLPEVKIIISLRDPVERAYSHYLMDLQTKVTELPFSKIIRMDKDEMKKNPDLHGILEPGFYFEQVKRYFNTFDSKRIKIVIFEEFIKEPKKTVENILKFLEVDSKISDFKPEIYNPYSVPRNTFTDYIINSQVVGKISQKFVSNSKRTFLKEKILTKKVSKPIFLEDDKEFLQKMYKKSVDDLIDFLGMSLPWKNFPHMSS